MCDKDKREKIIREQDSDKDARSYEDFSEHNEDAHQISNTAPPPPRRPTDTSNEDD